MRTGVVIDSACDLPQSYLQQHNIHIMPISLHFGYDTFKDVRDPDATQAFYRRYLSEKTLDAETAPFSVEQIKQLFLDELVLKYDRVLVITISHARSQIFANASEASFAILKQYREKRQQAGLNSPFYLTVLDSQTLFTGEGVLVHEAVRLLEGHNLAIGALRTVIEQLSQQVHAYLIPEDLFYLRYRGSKKGEKTIGLFGYQALWLGNSAVERALLIGSLLLLVIVELLNTGIEAAIDRIGLERHELSGRAKDIGSAAVFMALLNAAVVWLLILFG